MQAPILGWPIMGFLNISPTNASGSEEVKTEDTINRV
jgi:hypothetical protein